MEMRKPQEDLSVWDPVIALAFVVVVVAIGVACIRYFMALPLAPR